MTAPDTHRHPIDEVLRKRFESAWVEGRPEPIERFLPAEEDAKYLVTLEELIYIELEFAWKAWWKAEQRASSAAVGETIAAPPQVESYLQRFPRLREPETVRRLLWQEAAVRKQCGQAVSTEEYRRRFPKLRIADGEFEVALPAVRESSNDVRLADTMGAGPPGGTTVGRIESGQFGNYELLEELGRGGMGVVYRARQRSADRIVALKVIRRDRLESLPRDPHTSASALDRFRHEAQAAARLEHENIVTVYEVGEVSGQPFFSMRYVEGRNLAEIVKGGPIENRRAAAYMEPVARAVHEAHCQGILHRDLKPHNIPVDSKTDRALVADFGLAKLSEGNEGLTRTGEVLGTPSYMSPEQTKDSAQVTAKTDIYALGATLYHILTARPPFQAATSVETLRQVIDEEPAPPRQLNPSIDRDLETICLKCLEKEPLRRYDSAEAVADDLRRYLGGEPILARPIGSFGRTLRWCRRNPVMAALVALTATFLVLALVATAVGYVKTSAALRATEAAQKQSEKSFQQARAAVDDFFTLVSEDTLLNEPGMQPLRQKLLTKALDYYQQFLAQRGDDLTIRDELAVAHFREGLITEEIDSPQKALASYLCACEMQKQLVGNRPGDCDRLRALGNTWSAIGRVLHRQRKWDQAHQAHQEAAAVRKQLAEAAPEESEFRRLLANSYMNLGLVEKDRGNLQAAIRQIEIAQALRVKLLRQEPDNGKVRRDLGKGYFNLASLAMVVGDAKGTQKNFQDAIGVFEKLLASEPRDLPNQRTLAICYRGLADLKADDLRIAVSKGESSPKLYQQALSLYQKALERTNTLARENPAVPDYQADLAGLHMNLGQLESEQQHPVKALASFQEAREILKTLVAGYPKVAEYRGALAVTLQAIAALEDPNVLRPQDKDEKK